MHFNQHPTWFGVAILIDETSPTATGYYARIADKEITGLTPYLIVTYGRRRAWVSRLS